MIKLKKYSFRLIYHAFVIRFFDFKIKNADFLHSYIYMFLCCVYFSIDLNGKTFYIFICTVLIMILSQRYIQKFVPPEFRLHSSVFAKRDLKLYLAKKRF